MAANWCTHQSMSIKQSHFNVQARNPISIESEFQKATVNMNIFHVDIIDCDYYIDVFPKVESQSASGAALELLLYINIYRRVIGGAAHLSVFSFCLTHGTHVNVYVYCISSFYRYKQARCG